MKEKEKVKMLKRKKEDSKKIKGKKNLSICSITKNYLLRYL